MQSETIGAIAAALAKAQGEISPAPMDRNNPFFNSKYATLTSLWDSARAALSANGLAVTQVTDFDANGGIVLITTLLHSSGEWIGGVYPIRTADQKPQTLGSALTYARRYAFGALVGLTSDDDDDGNASNGNTNGGAQHTTKPAAAAVANGTATGKSNGSSPANGAGSKIWQTWTSAPDAKAWAEECGACANPFEANNSWIKLVGEKFDGKVTKQNMPDIFAAYYEHQMQKLHEKAHGVANGAPEMQPA